MTFRFSVVWAHVTIGLGMAAMIVGLGAGLGAALVPAGWLAPYNPPPGDRVLLAVASVLAGLFIGGPLIVVGQLILASLDLRQNVERLLERFVREDDVPCHFCGEPVRADATVCAYCRNDLRRLTNVDRLLTPR